MSHTITRYWAGDLKREVKALARGKAGGRARVVDWQLVVTLNGVSLHVYYKGRDGQVACVTEAL